MIGIIDYGMGNIRSVEKALEHLGYSSKLVSSPDEIAQSERLLLPGVGAFGDAMTELNRRNLIPIIKDEVKKGKPLFGICLGMQILFDSSEEAPGIAGLGLLKGTVTKFTDTSLKIPHMGWNRLNINKNSVLLANLPEVPHVYFVHSYYVKPDNDNEVAATCDYGIKFTAAVEQGNVGGTQFHPEKSQSVGMAILKNFAQWTPAASNTTV